MRSSTAPAFPRGGSEKGEAWYRGGFKATKPGELKGAISEAFAVDGPAIVDAVVAADELPNLPHIELETVGHYAMAKIKEALLAVTGA